MDDMVLRCVRLLLHGGDTMLGRAVQLTFPFQTPHEEYIRDTQTAHAYLQMAMHAKHMNCLVPLDAQELEDIRRQNQDGSYLWGDYYKQLIIQPPPDVRILNLENAVTTSITNRDVPRNKGITYHMHAANLPLVLKSFAATTFVPLPGTNVAGNVVQSQSPTPIPYAMVMANNHALDFGRLAFEQETMPLFEAKSLPGTAYTVGAGHTLAQASSGARIELPALAHGRQVLIIAVTTGCAGTPASWAATATRSGLVYLPALTSMNAVKIALKTVATVLQTNGLDPANQPYAHDLVVLSIHWGPNWAYRYGQEDDGQRFRQSFAHHAIRELGIDLIYGHSSHHIRGLELFHDKLIIYGAGDLINDYEGFANSGDEAYNKLGALFLVDLNVSNGQLVRLCLIPTYMDRLQLRRATASYQQWNPLSERMETITNGPQALCESINQLSKVDVGDHGGVPVHLRVAEHYIDVPNGPVLVYP